MAQLCDRIITMIKRYNFQKNSIRLSLINNELLMEGCDDLLVLIKFSIFPFSVLLPCICINNIKKEWLKSCVDSYIIGGGIHHMYCHLSGENSIFERNNNNNNDIYCYFYGERSGQITMHAVIFQMELGLL